MINNEFKGAEFFIHFVNGNKGATNLPNYRTSITLNSKRHRLCVRNSHSLSEKAGSFHVTVYAD